MIPDMCRCGHRLGLHGDRAVWPHCEGGDPPGPLWDASCGKPLWSRAAKDSVCDCKGFERGE